MARQRATGETTRPQGHGANGAAAPGTLGDSSPTANLAGVNIKGNEAFLHFPQESLEANSRWLLRLFDLI